VSAPARSERRGGDHFPAPGALAIMRRMRCLTGLLFAISLTLAAAGARAADGTLLAQAGGGWDGQPPPPPPAQQQPPQPLPPPGYAPYPAPYGLVPPPSMVYEGQKKSEFLALVLEFVLPGVGSIYAEHVAGALFTWATVVASGVLVFYWFDQNLKAINRTNTTGDGAFPGFQAMWAFWTAIGVSAGGRIFGIYDAYSSAKEYNRALRGRLGLPDWTVSLAPIRTDRAVSVGPALSLRF
jgi:hypothetical protein